MAIHSSSSPTTHLPCEIWIHVFSYLVNDRDNINNVVFARLRAVCQEFRDWLEDPSFRVHRNLFFVAQSFPSPFREIAVLEKKNHLQRIAVVYAKAGFIETGKKLYESNQTNAIDDGTLITQAEWHFFFGRFDEALEALKQMEEPLYYGDRLAELWEGLCSKGAPPLLFSWLAAVKNHGGYDLISKGTSWLCLRPLTNLYNPLL